ncbi:MAG: 3-oxoacyl-ACP synthase III family protein [Polyangiaceae bacterium]
MSRAGIIGMGVWVPDEVRTNDAWPASFVAAFQEKRQERTMRDFTNVDERPVRRRYEDLFLRHAGPYAADPFKSAKVRRITAPEVPTAAGDAVAARRALEDAAVDPGDVDRIFSSAIVPDRLAPSNGAMIQHLLGCPKAPGISVEGFCSSAVAQLDVAAALVESGRARFVLCVQSHQIARANDLEDPSSPIFGDGSTAFVVGKVDGDRGLQHLVCDGDGSLAGAVTWRHKATPDTPWWGNAVGPVCPGTDDPAAVRFVADNALAWPIETIERLCREADVPIDAVAAVATIQPFVWYAPAIAEGLGLPAERVPTTFATYAHLGGAGPIANLVEARRLGLLQRGAPVVLYAHGAGVTRYAALLRWDRAA